MNTLSIISDFQLEVKLETMRKTTFGHFMNVNYFMLLFEMYRASYQVQTMFKDDNDYNLVIYVKKYIQRMEGVTEHNHLLLDTHSFMHVTYFIKIKKIIMIFIFVSTVI